MLRQEENGPSERTDQSSRKNTTKRRRDIQPIRCIVQNTGNQDAHRIGWIWSQIRWKTKAILSEIKENVQGTNSDGKETGTQINAVDQKEERNIQPEQNEETRIKKKKKWETEEPPGQL